MTNDPNFLNYKSVPVTSKLNKVLTLDAHEVMQSVASACLTVTDTF